MKSFGTRFPSWTSGLAALAAGAAFAGESRPHPAPRAAETFVICEETPARYDSPGMKHYFGMIEATLDAESNLVSFASSYRNQRYAMLGRLLLDDDTERFRDMRVEPETHVAEDERYAGFNRYAFGRDQVIDRYGSRATLTGILLLPPAPSASRGTFPGYFELVTVEPRQTFKQWELHMTCRIDD